MKRARFLLVFDSGSSDPGNFKHFGAGAGDGSKGCVAAYSRSVPFNEAQ